MLFIRREKGSVAKNLTVSIVPVIVDNLLVCLTTPDLSIHSYFSDHSLQDKLIVLWMKIASREVSLYAHLSVVLSAGLVACVVTPPSPAGLAACVHVLRLLPDWQPAECGLAGRVCHMCSCVAAPP